MFDHLIAVIDKQQWENIRWELLRTKIFRVSSCWYMYYENDKHYTLLNTLVINCLQNYKHHSKGTFSLLRPRKDFLYEFFFIIWGDFYVLCWFYDSLFVHYLSISSRWFPGTKKMIEQIVNVPWGSFTAPHSLFKLRELETLRHLLWSFRCVKGRQPKNRHHE